MLGRSWTPSWDKCALRDEENEAPGHPKLKRDSDLRLRVLEN